jgi:hypothetical protein
MELAGNLPEAQTAKRKSIAATKKIAGVEGD